MQELLTFARPATPTLAPVSTRLLVERAIRLVHPSAERAGVRIVVDVGDTLPRFFADEEMLHQAIVNVVMNAVQATPNGGSVVVTAWMSDEHMHVSIADTGRGIAAENIDSVFKPFFTTRHTGTGLGLPISREIVQRHGGTVTIESHVNVGTTVIIHLPAGADEPAAAVEEAIAV
jgi:signal transduction histidine kinase